jgi:2,4'-dihydroxyacetophenone dioxygenase
MTLTVDPAPMTTSAGALLPLVALSQGELLTVNQANIPRINDALGTGVHFKPLRATLAEAQGLGPVDYIGGGAAGLMAREA